MVLSIKLKIKKSIQNVEYILLIGKTNPLDQNMPEGQTLGNLVCHNPRRKLKTH